MMFVIFEHVNGGFTQAHGRNKTYKTIDGAIANGIHQWGGPTPRTVKRTDNNAVVEYQGRTFVIVNVLDAATERATAALAD